MPLRNNTEITAAITDYMNNSKATGARVADWIRLAENRIARSMSQNGLLHKIDVAKTLTLSGATADLPADIRGLPEAIYIDSSPKYALDYMVPNEFFTRWASSSTGRPKAYTVRGKTLTFGPAPDSAYSLVVWYRQTPNIARTIDQVLIPELTETDFDGSPATEGSFAGGASHAEDDVITLSDGTKVTVEAVSTGAVTEFTLTETSSELVSLGDTLTQSGTTGSGTGFSLTIDQDSLSNAILLDHPELYLYGAVAEGFLFLENSSRATEFAGLFKEAIDTIAEEDFMSGATPRQFARNASAGAPSLPR